MSVCGNAGHEARQEGDGSPETRDKGGVGQLGNAPPRGRRLPTNPPPKDEESMGPGGRCGGQTGDSGRGRGRPAGAGGVQTRDRRHRRPGVGMRKASRQQGQSVGMRRVLNVHFPSTYRQRNEACSKAPWRLYTGVSQAPKAPDSVSPAKISTLAETP